jgi:alpha-L-rhamnosidase
MGDAQVFVRTATYNADVAAFFTKWLMDVDDGQTASGAFSDVSPDTTDSRGTPGWGDAGVICPWTIYEVYGDKRLLANNLPAMKRWINYLRNHSESFIRKGNRGGDYGDWLSINADTPKDLIGTAYFAYSTHLVAQACQALGDFKGALEYNNLFSNIAAAFNKEYVSGDGHIQSDTQTSSLLALKFGLLPESLRPKVAQYLRENIESKSNHLSTGFLGVSYLLPVLDDSGNAETAGKVLVQDTFPSWLFSVKHGATTIWERWDGWTPDKGFQDPGMNSFNHYSLGSCGEYLFGYIGGIRPATPGFKTFLIAPSIPDDLTWAKTTYDSIHGQISSYWKREGTHLDLDVTIPPNTAAIVCIPATDLTTITESGIPITKSLIIQCLRTDRGKNKVWLSVPSGVYRFASSLAPTTQL